MNFFKWLRGKFGSSEPPEFKPMEIIKNTKMIPSQNGLDFISKEEGCVLHSYQDQAGVWTIGIGSTMHKDGSRVKAGESITMAQAMDLLSWEVNNKAASVSNFTKGLNLNQNQYDSLVSFAYNVGIGALQNSTLLKRIKANPSDPTIRDAFMMWNKITVNGKLVPNDGLTGRRKREADLYFS
jgi:lysozyme